MPQPTDERTPQNPWPEYPTLKTDYGQQEAIALVGKDPRNYSVNTRLIEDAKGNISAVVTDEVRWVKDDTGRMKLETVPGTEKRWQADMVLLAMGFLGPEGIRWPPPLDWRATRAAMWLPTPI